MKELPDQDLLCLLLKNDIPEPMQVDLTSTFLVLYNNMKIRKVAKISNRYNQVPYLTKDTTWESYKNTVKHHKREPKGQPFPFI